MVEQRAQIEPEAEAVSGSTAATRWSERLENGVARGSNPLGGATHSRSVTVIFQGSLGKLEVEKIDEDSF